MNDSSIAALFVTFVLAQAGLFLDQRRRERLAGHRMDITDQKIDDVGTTTAGAADAAASAAEYARPVSNGFTGKVLSGLAKLSAQLDTLATEQREDRRRLNEHLGDHASADVRRAT